MDSDRERGLRPLAFDKMEGLVREMQDPETGVPVRSQKLFLTSIPSAFMGCDLIEWLMERLDIEESVEAVHIANQLCQYGYFFPVSDSKNLVVKDDGSLYRFQTPYYWPWQNRHPDNVDYAIYLSKRTLRNKQRHGLEDYELESLNSLRKNLQNKWDFITMQAEEQVRLVKERKKGDKIVSDSQERAYWRVYRPPPGLLNCLEPAPVPSRARAARCRKRSAEDLKREVDFLRSCLVRTRVKVSQALDNLVQHCETYAEYDPFLTPVHPTNPWFGEDPIYWQINSPLVEVPTEKRVRRWALSMEELVSDPTGLQEFTTYLRKEYSHENIRFWLAVTDLRRSAQSQIQRKVKEIFDEFLAPGAPCEINIDGKTMERVHQELRAPSRFTFDPAAEHVYALLLKKDCYPRFVRSEHYKCLLAAGVQPLPKKRFFNFGGPAKKKSTTTAPSPGGLALQQGPGGGGGTMGRRRGSDRSLSGSVHELVASGAPAPGGKVPHSHSQSNLSDIPYREPVRNVSQEEPPAERKDDVCPWDAGGEPGAGPSRRNSGGSQCDASAAVAGVSDQLRKASVEAPSEERVVARMQTVRKYSTASCVPPAGDAPGRGAGRKWSLAPGPLRQTRTEEEPSPGAWGADPPGHKSSDVCPWEDEESCKVDAPFVKTYATLGYL
ncbi:regulator of G-protein signaling 7 isoform X2 [Bacillus rossius redtenbacheri]|uniref:regulator of G-protein signaling 7 isoform X2 n=1 Tax=Bacillus rossius redtenbacheri TaxID=93214 RepID=UPI002FDEE7BA